MLINGMDVDQSCRQSYQFWLRNSSSYQTQNDVKSSPKPNIDLFVARGGYKID